MKELRYALLSDGPTDAALLPILAFLLRESGVEWAVQPEWVDLRNISPKPQGLTERILAALHWYETDLLFIHRDAEKEAWETRQEEIKQAVADAMQRANVPPTVCVIPIRMTEAWLIGHGPSLRRAAGNPNGKMPLHLPRDVEREADPKEIMYSLLRMASGLTERRLNRSFTSGSARRVAELTDDFSYLRGVSAFDALESEIKMVVQANNWNIAP